MTDQAPLLAADRDILQVGVGRGKPAGVGDRLIVGGMHPAGTRVDKPRQSIGIGGFQLGEAAMLDDESGDFMPGRCQPLHLIDVG